MIPSSWPFTVQGLDILGPFPRAVGGYRYLYIAIDKFIKWLEATPVVNITKASATAFLRCSLFGQCPRRSLCGSRWYGLGHRRCDLGHRRFGSRLRCISPGFYGCGWG